MAESERVDAYLDTIRRLEPDIAMVDRDAAMASIAISLKRIADELTAGRAERQSDLNAFLSTVQRAVSRDL